MILCKNCKYIKKDKCLIFSINKPARDKCKIYAPIKNKNSKTKIFAHVGLGKSGSTFLQRSVFPKLKDVNFVHCAGFRMRIKPDEINLFSAESLSGMPTRPPVPNIDNRYVQAERLQKIFPDLNIILILREKKSLLNSYYKSYVRIGGPLTYKDWYEKIFDPDCLDFDSYVAYLKKLFKNVGIFYFEDLQKDSDAFVKNICDFIGCKVPGYNKTKKNMGYNETQTRITRFMNKFFKSELNSNGFIPRGKYLNADTIIYMPYLKKLFSKR